MLLRVAVGGVLREHRKAQRRTLRDLSLEAACSPAHLSEVERGFKEASSEVLASIAAALGVPVAQVVLEAARMIHQHARPVAARSSAAISTAMAVPATRAVPVPATVHPSPTNEAHLEASGPASPQAA